MSRGIAGLRDEAMAQAPRWALWAPVAFGLGSAIYFNQKTEPPVWIGFAAGLLALALAAAASRIARRSGGWIVAALLALAAAGFADGKLATEMARAPVVPDGLGAVTVRGWVVDIVEGGAGRMRLLIAPVDISGLSPAQTPARVRLSLRTPLDVAPGDAISAFAILDPPPGPASPGGFDFARDAWFARLGGVGLALTAPRAIRLPPMGVAPRLQTGLNALRWRLAERLVGDLGGGPGAGLAAAVTTSHQAWLPEDDAQDLRNSGLAHMLAIAGLHTAAVAGFAYAAVRLLVAAWPWLALRVSGKKLAAAAGLLTVLAYLALSGAHPPARRAAITAGAAFLAILADRRPISMRSLALAALVVLAVQPVAVTQPGFQMSFCATAALVAMAELWPAHGPVRGLPWFISWPQRLRDWTAAMLMVSLVAGLATAPFALQHFNRMANYGLFANFGADLLASLVLMPALVLCVIGEALNVDPAWFAAPRWVAEAAGQGVLDIARLFATWPGATRSLPSAPQAALVVAFCGIVFACLWRGRLRWAAVPLAAAVLVWPRPPAPSAWIAEDGDNAAIVEDGRAVVLKPTVRAFAANAFISHRGLLAPFDPVEEAALAFDCSRSQCVPRLGTHPAMGAWWMRRPPSAAQLAPICEASDIVLVRGSDPDPGACPGALLLSLKDFKRGGSAEVYPAAEGWRVHWAAAERGLRPWSEPAIVAPPRPKPAKRGRRKGLSP